MEGVWIDTSIGYGLVGDLYNNAGLNLDYCEPLMQHVYLRGPISAIIVAEDYSVVCFVVFFHFQYG